MKPFRCWGLTARLTPCRGRAPSGQVLCDRCRAKQAAKETA